MVSRSMCSGGRVNVQWEGVIGAVEEVVVEVVCRQAVAVAVCRQTGNSSARVLRQVALPHTEGSTQAAQAGSSSNNTHPAAAAGHFCSPPSLTP